MFYSINSFSNIQSFYENAFKDSMFMIWGQTKFWNETTDLSYKRAMSIFLNDNYIAEQDRRQLLYEYCKPQFSVENNDDILNKLIPILPTDNLIVKRTVRSICQLYNDNPTRSIEGKNADLLLEILNKSNINIALYQAHQISKLTNECIIGLQIINGEPYFEVYSPDNYRCEMNPYGEIEELWISKPRIIGDIAVSTFDVWTKEDFSIRQSEDEYIELNYNNTKVKKIPNTYKAIPFILIQMTKNNQYMMSNFSGGLWELVKSQLDSNKIKITQDNNLLYNGFSMLMFVNTGLSGSPRVGAGQAIVLDGVTMDTGEVPPAIDVISPGTQYNEMYELRKNQIKDCLRNLELPTSMISDEANLQSGTAMKIERIGLDEYRRHDIGLFKLIEQQLINLTALVLTYDLSSNYRGRFNSYYDVTIDFVEFTAPTDDAMYLEQTESLYNKGLITTKEYVNRMTGKEFATDEEAMSYIENNLQNKVVKMDNIDTNNDEVFNENNVNNKIM